jgi:hypothetical protein
MAELKTKPSDASVERFLAAIEDEARRADCRALVRIMKEATGSPPRMWGSSIVGFGDYHFKYASGREGDWFLTGFSPRKQDLTLYVMGGFENHRDLMEKLGKFKTGKGCLYLKRLDDAHLPTLKRLILRSVKQIAKPPRRP